MTRFVFALILCLLTFSGVAAEGASDSGPGLLKSRIDRPAAGRHDPSIRVDVDLATVPVTVLDRLGRNVSGLQRMNFRVFDGGTECSIASFTREDAPVSAGLVFDMSGSMTGKFQAARRAVSELFQHLNPGDESSLVTVSSRAALSHGFTTHLQDIENALLFVSPRGTTPLLDGVYLGLAEMKKARNPRKALIVVSDGGENSSRYTLRELLEMAEESETLIYGIGVFQNPQSQEEVDGPDLLAELSRRTGGLVFEVAGPAGARTAMSTIGISLHNQYVLGYYPPPKRSAGVYRKIQVQVVTPKGTPRLQVYARRGYYEPPK